MITDTGQSTVNPLPALGTEWQVGSTRDFNADGKADIYWEKATTGESQIWLSGGTNLLSRGNLPALGTQWQLQADADLNGDGRADLFYRNTVTGDNLIRFIDETNIIATATTPVIPRVANTDWNVLAKGDFDGNGTEDLFWENQTKGWVASWLMNGARAPSVNFDDTVPIAWDVKGVGDFDGDGTDDLFWTNSTNNRTAVWLMQGGVARDIVVLDFLAPGTTVEAVKDYTSDGNADIYFSNGITGQNTVWAFQTGTPVNPLTYTPIALPAQTPGFEVVDPTIV